MKCFIGIGKYHISLYHCTSLKEKRRIMKSIIDRLGGRKNIFAAEVGGNDLWKSGVLVIGTISSSYEVSRESLVKSRRLIESSGAHVIDEETWVFRPEDFCEAEL